MMKKTVLVFLFIVLLACRASAMQAVQPEGNTVKISGGFDDGEAVTVRIIGPDIELSDYYDAELEAQRGMLVHFDQVMPYEGFEYVFTLDGDTGKYYAVLTQEEASETAEFDFVNTEEQKSIVEELRSVLDKTSEQTLDGFLKKYGEKLSGTDRFAKIKDEGISDIADNIRNSFENTGDDNADYASLCAIIYAGVIRESVFDTGMTAEELKEYAAVLEIEDTEEYKTFCANETEYEALPKKLSAVRCADGEEFRRLLAQGMLLCRFEKTQHVSQIYPLVEELKNAGFDTGKYFSLSSTYNADMKLVGKSFDKCSELAEFIKSICAGGTGGGGSGSGGSSGGTSGGGSSKSTTVSAPGNSAAGKTENDNIFADVDSSHWASESIRILYKNGILSGNENNCFEPERDVCREEFVKMLICAFGIDAEAEECGFKDVLPGDWYYPYVAAARKYGIVNGISEDEFGAGVPIKRQDAAVIAYNAIGFRSYNAAQVQETAFDDYDEIDGYAAAAVKALAGAGVINGYDGRFYPEKNITRAEAAKMVYYIMKNIMN